MAGGKGEARLLDVVLLGGTALEVNLGPNVGHAVLV